MNLPDLPIAQNSQPSQTTPPPKKAEEEVPNSFIDSAGPLELSPLDDEEYVNMLFFSPFGGGKTVLGGTAQLCEDTAHVFCANAEGGTKSIKETLKISIDTYRINTFTAFNKLYEFARVHAYLRDEYIRQKDKSSTAAKDIINKMRKLEAGIKEVSEDKITLPKIYKTFFIDSLTEVQKYSMYHLLGIDINKISLTEDIGIPKIQDWGKSAEMIRLLVRAFRDLRMHVIFTTHDQVVKDERDGSITIVPSLPGKLPNEICGFLDIVGYLHVVQDPATKQSKRVLQFQPGGRFQAKCRYPQLGTHMEDPTIAKIIKTIKGGKG